MLMPRAPERNWLLWSLWSQKCNFHFHFCQLWQKKANWLKIQACAKNKPDKLDGCSAFIQDFIVGAWWQTVHVYNVHRCSVHLYFSLLPESSVGALFPWWGKWASVSARLCYPRLVHSPSPWVAMVNRRWHSNLQIMLWFKYKQTKLSQNVVDSLLF